MRLVTSIDQLIHGNYISRIRNVKIASAFKEAQLIEKYGSGIKRIQQGFSFFGLKPPFFEEFQGGFRVTVYSESELPPVGELGEKLGGNQSWVIFLSKSTDFFAEKLCLI